MNRKTPQVKTAGLSAVKTAGRIAALLALAFLAAGCNNFFHDLVPPDGDRILSFRVPGQTGPAAIGENSVTVSVPAGADLRSLLPKITVSPRASLMPLTLDYVAKAFPGADLVGLAAVMYSSGDLSSQVMDLIRENPGFNVPELSLPVDFSGPVTFLVIGGQGSIRRYAAAVIADTGEPAITSFRFSKYDNPELVADALSVVDEKNGTVMAWVKYPAEMPGLSFALVPSLEMLGDGITVDSVPVRSGIDPVAFTPGGWGLQTKTVTASRNGVTRNYALTVLFQEDPDTVRSITDFRFLKTSNSGVAATAVGAVVDNDHLGTITVQVFHTGPRPSTLIPHFVTPGSVTVGNVPQTSGAGAQDFSAPLEYVVRSRDGRYVRAYTVRVEFISLVNDAPKLLSFRFSRALNSALVQDAEGTIAGDLVLVEARYGGHAAPGTLVPEFGAGGLVTVQGSVQTGGASAQDFSRQVKYTVAHPENPLLKRDYWVQVRLVRDTSSDAGITAFGFHPDENPGLGDEITARIDQAAGTVTLYAPPGSGVTARTMYPRFAAAGRVEVSGAAQTSGASGQVFGSPLVYTAISANGANTKSYTVTVRELRSTVYVDRNAAGMNDGTSWADAFVSLSAACEAAGQFPPEVPREIWIAKGTYRPGETGDRDAYFVLSPNTSYVGGFAGGETAKSQRDTAANPVVISGDLGGGQLQYSRNLFANCFADGYTPVPLAGDVAFLDLRFEKARADKGSGRLGRSGAAVYVHATGDAAVTIPIFRKPSRRPSLHR